MYNNYSSFVDAIFDDLDVKLCLVLLKLSQLAFSSDELSNMCQLAATYWL
jgi:hypothetical protein